MKNDSKANKAADGTRLVSVSISPMQGVFSRFLRCFLALALCVGSANAPAFAADNVLSPDYVAPAPTTTLAVADAEPTPIVETQSASEGDQFITDGPLSPAAVSVTQGRALYVSATGSDTATGLDAGASWKTIAYAVSQLQAGDTLYIAEGIYQQPGAGAVFSTSGTSDAYITIQGVGNVVIEGVNTTTISGYQIASNYNPAFNTNGQDYLRFKNLTVNNLRDAVEVGPGSSYVEVDGLKSDRNHFAVKINSADHVTVRNVVATNSRNGFRVENNGGIIPSDILFENIDVSGSADVYSGFETRYRNGDGFIFEAGNKITIRNVVSYDNWDGGFDIKATNVLLENVTTFGNKNNFKIWGSGIIVKNSLSYGAKVRVDDPVAGEGYGVNNRMGQITFINTTFVDNETADIRIDNDGGPSSTTLENCLIVRRIASGASFVVDGGSMIETNNIWYWAGHTDLGFTLSGSSLLADPKFVNWDIKDFHLQSSSPAVNFGSSLYPATTVDRDGNTRIVSGMIDVGAYEYQGYTAPDTSIPIISAVSATNVTSGGATINWTTDELSDSQVEYRILGTTLWSATAMNTSMLKNHSVIMSGLSSNSAYEYRVKSKDQAGNLATQGTTLMFTTPIVDVLPPTMTSIAASSVSTTSATISWATNEPSDSQVEYRLQGSTAWLASSISSSMITSHSVDLSGMAASSVYEFRVKSKDSVGNLAVQSILSNFITGAPSATCATAICGVSEGSTVSGRIMVQPSLALNPDIRKIAYYLNGSLSGREYTDPFTWGGATGFDTTQLADGVYALGGAYTTSAGDQAFSLTITVRNAAPADTAAPVISAAAVANITSSSATISWTTNEASDSQVEYRISGGSTWLQSSVNSSMVTSHSLSLGSLSAGVPYEFRVKSKDQAGNLATQLAIFSFTTLPPPDTIAPVISAAIASSVTTAGATISWTTNEVSDSQVEYRIVGSTAWSSTNVNTTMVTNHSMVLTGLTSGTAYEFRVKSKDPAGNLATMATISNFATAIPSTACITAMCGLSNNQTVSGTIMVQPNLALNPDIRKAAYYLNGTFVGREYSAPFTLGGTAGFDTTKLADGTYTLGGAYTTRTGDKTFSITFTVNNSVFKAAAASPACTTSICGVTDGQTVSGVISVSPNLAQIPGVRKVAYYLNGVLLTREYKSPFTLGGAAGFDTTKLANGTYVLSGAYTTATGDVPFTMKITVKN